MKQKQIKKNRKDIPNWDNHYKRYLRVCLHPLWLYQVSTSIFMTIWFLSLIFIFIYSIVWIIPTIFFTLASIGGIGLLQSYFLVKKVIENE